MPAEQPLDRLLRLAQRASRRTIIDEVEHRVDSGFARIPKQDALQAGASLRAQFEFHGDPFALVRDEQDVGVVEALLAAPADPGEPYSGGSINVRR